MNELLLTSINDSIDKIEFDINKAINDRCKIKAKILCACIFKQYINDKYGTNFDLTREFASEYFNKILTGDRAKVKKQLENAGILQKSKSYTVGQDGKEGKAKSYNFNPDLIYSHSVSFTKFQLINKIDDRVKIVKIKENLELLKVDPAVYAFIPELVQKQFEEIETGEQIIEMWIKKRIGNVDVYKHRNYFEKIAENNKLTFFKFKKRFYVEDIAAFIKRKTVDLEILYTYQIESIQNGNFYGDRNTTNNRLDHNGTGLKSELWKYILLDGQPTVEIDIKNAQFAILANIPDFHLDDEFKKHAQKGSLYGYITENTGLKHKVAKNYMFKSAFCKVKNHPEILTELFPTTMASITRFKVDSGYNNFSILLQKRESNLMIDGVFNMITNENLPVVPVHDSMRVRECDYDKVRVMMENFFTEKNIKVTLDKK